MLSDVDAPPVETPIPAQVNTKAKAYGQRVMPSNLDAPPVMAPDAIEYN